MDYRIQLTDVEVVHRLLSFDDDLSQAYRYYQDLILSVSHRDQGELNQLLSQKWTTLPWPLQKVQRTLRSHKLEIIWTHILVAMVTSRALLMSKSGSSG